uniref:Uncharacterized protein n=1 Tax=Wuchereria bancrofti TaxID=6293 RepID=A0A1I8EZ79_WUCBA
MIGLAFGDVQSFFVVTNFSVYWVELRNCPEERMPMSLRYGSGEADEQMEKRPSRKNGLLVAMDCLALHSNRMTRLQDEKYISAVHGRVYYRFVMVGLIDHFLYHWNFRCLQLITHSFPLDIELKTSLARCSDVNAECY